MANNSPLFLLKLIQCADAAGSDGQGKKTAARSFKMEQTGLTPRFDPSRCEHRGVYGRDQMSSPHDIRTLLWEQEVEEQCAFIIM